MYVSSCTFAYLPLKAILPETSSKRTSTGGNSELPFVQMTSQTEKFDFQMSCISWQIQMQTRVILELIFCSRCRHSCSLQLREGSIVAEHMSDFLSFSKQIEIQRKYISEFLPQCICISVLQKLVPRILFWHGLLQYDRSNPTRKPANLSFLTWPRKKAQKENSLLRRLDSPY